MTQRYAHLQPTAFREDYDRFHDLTVGPGVVVSIARQAEKMANGT